MPTREGAIKITLKSGSFQAGMKRMTSAVKSAGLQMGKALKEPMNKGLSAVRSSMGSMLDDLKGGLKTAATLGGAVSFGVMIKGAVESQSAYIALAHSISNYSGKATKALDVQKMVNDISMRTGTTIGNLRIQLSKLEAIPGGLKEIAPALERAAMQTKRLGIEGEYVDSVARTYSRLFAKGVVKTAEEAEILTEQINKFGRAVLGVDPDEAIDPMDIAEYGAFINRMNSGLGETNALLGMTGGQVKDMGQAWMFLEEVGLALATTEGLDKLRKSTKLSKKDINLTKGAVENLLVVLEKKGPQAFKALLDSFGPDEAKLALSEVIGKEILIKAEAGKLSKAEWELRIEGIRGELDKAKNAVFDFKSIEETNNKLMNTSSANMNRALTNLSMAFAEPKMMKAINDITRELPKLAEGFAGIIKWVIDRPSQAAASYLLIRVSAVFVSAAVKSAAAAGMTKIMAILAAQAAAGKASGSLLGLGKGAGKGAMAGALGASALGVGIAAALGAAAGYGIFKLALEPALEDGFDNLKDTTNRLGDVSYALRTSSIEKKKAVLADVKSQLKIMEKGPGFGVSLVSDLTNLFDDDAVEATTIYKKKTDELRKSQEQLIKSIKSMAGAAKTAGENLNKVGEAAGKPAVHGPKTDLNKEPGAKGVEG